MSVKDTCFPVLPTSKLLFIEEHIHFSYKHILGDILLLIKAIFQIAIWYPGETILAMSKNFSQVEDEHGQINKDLSTLKLWAFA